MHTYDCPEMGCSNFKLAMWEPSEKQPVLGPQGTSENRSWGNLKASEPVRTGRFSGNPGSLSNQWEPAGSIHPVRVDLASTTGSQAGKQHSSAWAARPIKATYDNTNQFYKQDNMDNIYSKSILTLHIKDYLGYLVLYI